MYIIGTYKKVYVHLMYMERPSVPEEIVETVSEQSRPYETSWWQTLERILEQDADLQIKSKEVEA